MADVALPSAGRGLARRSAPAPPPVRETPGPLGLSRGGREGWGALGSASRRACASERVRE